MELKPGYKQTEVGIVPEDWEVKQLGEIASVSSGGTPDRLNPTYWGGDVPWVTTTQINFNLIDKANEFITRKGLENSAARVYNPGTLLMAMYGQGKTRGKVAVLAMSAAINQACAAIILGRGISSKYVFFNLSARYEEIRSLSNTGNQENLNATIIKSILLPLPKGEDEQRAIVAALSDVDALITSLDRLIAKKRDIKQATMQQLLTGKTRLPGFGGEWEVKKVGEITQSTAGGTPSTSIKEYWGGNIKWMNSGELNAKKIYDVEGRITEEGLKNSSTKIIPSRCILVGLAGQGKTRGTIAINMVELCTNQSIAAIFPSPQFIPEYLYFNLDSRYDELRNLSTGEGGRGGLNLSIINSLMIPLPSLPEQRAIATILSDMDAEIAVLEQKRDKTLALKQAMMQELLTGKTRLI